MSAPVAMSLRDAILAAAKHIEANPRLYRDAETRIPENRSARGSALGWIAHFAGYRRPDQCDSGMALVLADMPQAFHHRMNELDRRWRSWFVSWRSSARVAARRPPRVRGSLPPHWSRVMSSACEPVATIRAYRKTGGAVVTVERDGRPAHRYQVSLRRYHALREWTAFGSHPWKSSGAWLKGSLLAHLWAKEVGTAKAE